MPIIVLTYHNRFYSKPRLRIQLRLFLPQLEMEDRGITIFRIRIDPSDRLTGRDPVARFHIYLTQIAINRQVVTMTNDYGLLYPGTTNTRVTSPLNTARASAPGEVWISIPLLLGTNIFQLLMLQQPNVETIVCLPATGYGKRPRLLAKLSDNCFSAFVIA